MNAAKSAKASISESEDQSSGVWGTSANVPFQILSWWAMIWLADRIGLLKVELKPNLEMRVFPVKHFVFAQFPWNITRKPCN